MTEVTLVLRRLVTERAGNCCEYCRLSQEDVKFSFHIEHIRSKKHGGETDADTLCLSCPACNSYKGTDIASADPHTGSATFLFHPRRQVWLEHFRLNNERIEPLTPEGRVTVLLLRLNSSERLAERALLIKLDSYPCEPKLEQS
jgi:hypothetical protein